MIFDPEQTLFLVVSFEGPDVYSQAGGLGVRVKELSGALADRGYRTHLFFVGDPTLPGEEEAPGSRLTLHRWCQWISRHHPTGVYAGEEQKMRDMERSLPPALISEHIRPAVESGMTVVILAEEWQVASTIIGLARTMQFEGLRDHILLLWNANNHFGFDRIDWSALTALTTVTTVSRYMKQIMWRWGANPLVIPNGIPASMIGRTGPAQVRALRAAAGAPIFMFKIGRFSPDKRWHQAVSAVARLKGRGLKARMLIRGGLEPFGGQVLEHARKLGMQVASIDDRINDLPSLTGALQCLPDADIWNLTSFLPEELLPVIYAAATATLANSGHEPFGLVGLEAMASGGIAFVGTTGEDYAQPFRNAIVIETEDPDEIVVQVNHLGQYPDEARRLRMAAQRTARDFTWQRVLDTLLRRLEFVATSQRLAQ